MEIGLQDRIDFLEDHSDEKNRALLDLPARVNQKVFDMFWKLYCAVIESKQFDVLDSPLLMQYTLFNIDEARNFALSKCTRKSDQAEYARQEGDKIRLLWSYFLRFVDDPKKTDTFSHCNTKLIFK